MACKTFTTEDYLAIMTAFRDEMQSCRESFNKRLDRLEKQRSSQPTVRSSTHPSVHPSRQPIIHPSTHPTVHPSAQPIVHSSNHPIVHLTIRPTVHQTTHPTDHPYVHPTDQPTIHPTDHPYIHLIEPVLRIEPIQGGGNDAESRTRLIIRPDDIMPSRPTARSMVSNIYPSIQSARDRARSIQDRLPRPILADPAIQCDGPPLLIIKTPPWNRASNGINHNQFKSIVPAIIRLTIQVRPSQAEPPRPPDQARSTLELSEGYLDITTSEWPLLLTGKETFLFQQLPGLTFKPPAGLGPEILITSQESISNGSFHTWPAD